MARNRGGRLTKWKGRVASIAPALCAAVMLTPVIAQAQALVRRRMDKAFRVILSRTPGLQGIASQAANMRRASVSASVALCAVVSLLPLALHAQSVAGSGDIVTSDPVTSPSWVFNGNTFIGNTGSGALSVDGGGTVTGNGNLDVGESAGSSGQIVVDGMGSVLTPRLNFYVGNYGYGQIFITNGGVVHSPDPRLYGAGSTIVLGQYAGSTGKIFVNGPGSSLVLDTNFFLGTFDANSSPTRSGTGVLDVSGGGSVISSRYLFFSNGTVHVTGAGSIIDTANIQSGFGGTTNILVEKGGIFNVNSTYGCSSCYGASFYGDRTPLVSTITVTDAGSQFDSAGTLRVGYGSGGPALGTLNILNGATATVGDFAIVGIGAGAAGVANVSGAGSTWNVADSFDSLSLGLSIGFGLADYPGTPTTGIVTLSDAGVINAPFVKLGVDNGAASTGTLNIGAAAGAAAVAPGTLNAASIFFNTGYGESTGASTTGVLNFNHTSTDGSYAFAAAMSSSAGSATINQIAGNTNLTGDSSAYGGVTNVTGGTLRVNGTLGNAASTMVVSNGGTLGGAGTVGGSVAITDGILAPGNGPGTLTINGDLALTSASQLNYELGAANTVGGALNDLTDVAGNLTLDGTLNVTQSAGGTFGAGIYRLINYGGSLTDSGLALGSMPASSTNYVQTSVAQQVNLVNSNGLLLNFWDGDAGGRNDGAIAGGDGTWTADPAGADRWTEADGLINAPYQNPSFAIFQGAPGHVTVDNSMGAVAVTGMQFATSGYLIQGGDVTLGVGTDAIRVGDGTPGGAATTATIAANLVGAGRLDKVDVGTLVLAGTNTYTGGTQVSGGTLQLGDGGTVGSLVGDVTDNATLAFNHSGANTFAGTISGSGTVMQIGSGTTTLAAVNTYTGGTTVSTGTLSGSATSFGSGTITDNAALIINQPTGATMANAINGTGTLAKTGTGVLNYTGTGTLFGATTVAQGTLVVNGALANSGVTVSSGATLAGAGTVGATTVQSGGTVAPGSNGANGPIGTLSVNGNYVQAAGSAYQVKVDSSTLSTADRINVAGTASVATGSVLNVTRTSSSPYALNSQYTVLNATGGVNGKFMLTGDTTTAFVRISDTYDANNVYLTASQVRAFTDAGGTRNQIATGGGLDTLSTSNALRNAVAFLPNDVAARAAFDQLSGEEYASMQTALMDDSRFVRDAANDRLMGAFCAPGASIRTTKDATNSAKRDTSDACASAEGSHVWASAFGSTGHLGGDGNAIALANNYSGLFLGADTTVESGWRVGGLTGWSHGTMKAANGSSQTDDYHLGVYGGNEWGGTSLRLGADYTRHALSTQRSVVFPGFSENLSSDHGGTTTQVFGEVGHRFDLGNALAVEPFVGLAYVNVKTDAFAERGGIAALNVDGSSMAMTFSTLGAHFSENLGNKTALRGMLGWKHAFGDVTPTSTNSFQGGQPFAVAGVPFAKDMAVIELGIETEFQPNLSMSVSYSGQFAEKLQDNSVALALNYKF